MSMIHEITAGVARNRKRTRKGRGEGSGHGKTCGRGTKGTKARVGKYIRRGYEGGQTEIYRRFPKRGFSNVNFASRFYVVNIEDLARFPDGTTVDAAALREAGLIPDFKQPVKILGDGAMALKLVVHAGWYTKSAHQKILDAGGQALTPAGATFEFPKPKKIFVPREKGSKKAEKPAAAAAPETPAPAAE